MYPSEIKAFKDFLRPDDAPFHSVAQVAGDLGEVANMLDHVLGYAADIHCPPEEVDTLHALVRGSLALLREVGEFIDELTEVAKGWTAQGDRPEGDPIGQSAPPVECRCEAHRASQAD